MQAEQYRTLELTFEGAEPKENPAEADVTAVFTKDGAEKTVKGFYAGNNTYKVRFLPEETGTYSYRVTGEVSGEGSFEAAPAKEGAHGIVRAKGTHFAFEDGTWFYPFGTTVYALAHQTDALMDETIESIRKSPFNKVRMCVFPKDYHYNKNEPQYYAFEKREDGTWDVERPDYRFWDAFEDKIRRLGEIGVQVDLILFHPYDRWGFSKLPQKDNLVYLDYLLRRFAAIPNIWWSLSNEYDLTPAKSLDDWYEIEGYVHDNDPFHHLLSNHNCFHWWDATRPDITHDSLQIKSVYPVAEELKKTGKPVMVDECCYEGNLAEPWGSISGAEMTARFWEVVVRGGYCTHGETYLDPDTKDEDSAIVWWAKGGKLIGKSPERIQWLKDIVDSLPGPIDPVTGGFGDLLKMSKEEIDAMIDRIPEEYRFFVRNATAVTPFERGVMLAGEYNYDGHVGDDVYLWYLNRQTSARYPISLPKDHTYKVEVLDTWEMTRTTFGEHLTGDITVRLPAKEYMAILATKE